MASRYNITNKATFNPFNFEEYLKPALIYSQLYKEQEDALTDLNVLANQIAGKINSQTDPIAAKRYSDFYKKINDQVNGLLQNGLSPSVRQLINNLKGEYKMSILPIEEAYNRKNAAIKMLLEASAKDPYTIVQDATMESLDKYLMNPSYSPKQISGSAVTNHVGNQLSQYKQQLMNKPEWRQTAQGQLLEKIETYGLTPEIIQKILNPATSSQYSDIVNILDRAIKQTGVYDWKTEDGNYDYDAINKVTQAAYDGLAFGLGTQKSEVLKNADYLSPYDQWKWGREITKAKREDYLYEKLLNGDGDENYNMMYDWAGTDVTPDKDINAKELNNDLIALNSILTNKEYKTELDIPQKVKKSTGYLTNYTARGSAGRVETFLTIDNPQYIALQRAKKKYGDLPILELIEKTQEDVYKKAKSTHVAYMRTAASNNLMNWLNTQLISGNLEIADKIKIASGKDKGKTPKEEELIEVLKSSKNKLGINPTNGKPYLLSPETNKEYELNPSILHNLYISNVRGDEYIKQLSLAYNENTSITALDNSKLSLSQPQNKALSDALNNFFSHIEVNINSAVQEAPTSNRKASLYDLGIGEEESADDYLSKMAKRKRNLKSLYNN